MSKSRSRRAATGPTAILFILLVLHCLLQLLFQVRAAQPPVSPFVANHQDREVITLNLTNFNPELIQAREPFPHIKLVEFYVSYCNFCAKFKQTFYRLARKIQPWRNVLRPAAIDLSAQLNIAIANARPVDEVPKLRLHPPPAAEVARHLDKQYAALRNTFALDAQLLQTTNTNHSLAYAQTELQKSMLDEFALSNLMIEPLDNTKQYLDNVPLLKAHLVNYLERFVQHRTKVQQLELPRTWPDLRPVSESSLAELWRRHPRKQLFLIIEGQPSSAPADLDQSSTGPVSLGLSIMMELSSGPAWRAVRYVRASENKPLIEDVISNLNASSGQLEPEASSPPQPQPANDTSPTGTTSSSSQQAFVTVTTQTISSSSAIFPTTSHTSDQSPNNPQYLSQQQRRLQQQQQQPQPQQHNHNHYSNLHNNQNLHAEHLELLNNLLLNKTKSGNNILLLHMQDLAVPLQQNNQDQQRHLSRLQSSSENYSPTSSLSSSSSPSHLPHETSSITASRPFISVVSGIDLASMDLSEMLDSLEIAQQSNNGGRAKRVVIDHHHLAQEHKLAAAATPANHHEAANLVKTQRDRRSMALSSVRPSMPDDQVTRERLVEVVSAYVRQTYTETDADRAFVKALNQLEDSYQTPFGVNYIVIACFGCLLLMVVLRWANSYVERQRRHKATLLNGNAAQYSSELK